MISKEQAFLPADGTTLTLIPSGTKIEGVLILVIDAGNESAQNWNPLSSVPKIDDTFRGKRRKIKHGMHSEIRRVKPSSAELGREAWLIRSWESQGSKIKMVKFCKLTPCVPTHSIFNSTWYRNSWWDTVSAAMPFYVEHYTESSYGGRQQAIWSIPLCMPSNPFKQYRSDC